MRRKHVVSEETKCRIDALTGETLEDFAQRVVDGLCDPEVGDCMTIVNFFQTRSVSDVKLLPLLSLTFLQKNFRADIASVMWAYLHPQALIVTRLYSTLLDSASIYEKLEHVHRCKSLYCPFVLLRIHRSVNCDHYGLTADCAHRHACLRFSVERHLLCNCAPIVRKSSSYTCVDEVIRSVLTSTGDVMHGCHAVSRICVRVCVLCAA